MKRLKSILFSLLATIGLGHSNLHSYAVKKSLWFNKETKTTLITLGDRHCKNIIDSSQIKSVIESIKSLLQNGKKVLVLLEETDSNNELNKSLLSQIMKEKEIFIFRLGMDCNQIKNELFQKKNIDDETRHFIKNLRKSKEKKELLYNSISQASEFTLIQIQNLLCSKNKEINNICTDMMQNKKNDKKSLCRSKNCLNNFIDICKNYEEKTKKINLSIFRENILEVNHRLVDMRIIQAIAENKKEYDVIISVSGFWHDDNIQKEIPNLGFIKQNWPQNKIKKTIITNLMKKIEHPTQPVNIGRFDEIVERLLNQNSLSDYVGCAIQ